MVAGIGTGTAGGVTATVGEPPERVALDSPEVVAEELPHDRWTAVSGRGSRPGWRGSATST